MSIATQIESCIDQLFDRALSRELRELCTLLLVWNGLDNGNERLMMYGGLLQRGRVSVSWLEFVARSCCQSDWFAWYADGMKPFSRLTSVHAREARYLSWIEDIEQACIDQVPINDSQLRHGLLLMLSMEDRRKRTNTSSSSSSSSDQMDIETRQLPDEVVKLLHEWLSSKQVSEHLLLTSVARVIGDAALLKQLAYINLDAQINSRAEYILWQIECAATTAHATLVPPALFEMIIVATMRMVTRSVNVAKAWAASIQHQPVNRWLQTHLTKPDSPIRQVFEWLLDHEDVLPRAQLLATLQKENGFTSVRIPSTVHGRVRRAIREMLDDDNNAVVEEQQISPPPTFNDHDTEMVKKQMQQFLQKYFATDKRTASFQAVFQYFMLVMLYEAAKVDNSWYTATIRTDYPQLFATCLLQLQINSPKQATWKPMRLHLVSAAKSKDWLAIAFPIPASQQRVRHWLDEGTLETSDGQQPVIRLDDAVFAVWSQAESELFMNKEIVKLEQALEQVIHEYYEPQQQQQQQSSTATQALIKYALLQEMMISQSSKAQNYSAILTECARTIAQNHPRTKRMTKMNARRVADQVLHNLHTSDMYWKIAFPGATFVEVEKWYDHLAKYKSAPTNDTRIALNRAIYEKAILETR